MKLEEKRSTLFRLQNSTGFPNIPDPQPTVGTRVKSHPDARYVEMRPTEPIPHGVSQSWSGVKEDLIGHRGSALTKDPVPILPIPVRWKQLTGKFEFKFLSKLKIAVQLTL